MKLPIVYPAANMTNLEWMAGQVAAGTANEYQTLSETGRGIVATRIVELAQAILVEVQKAERELPDLGD